VYMSVCGSGRSTDNAGDDGQSLFRRNTHTIAARPPTS
jgi:hypothetical protein